MEENMVENVQEMLKEETWTRTSISAYSTANIARLQDVVRKASEGGLEKEIKEVCDEHLTHAKDSVPALYISGMLSLGETSLDNSHLIDLMNIFQRNHKVEEAKMLCKDILDKDSKNKFALRTLAACYKDEKNDAMWPLYEKIVKLDSTEAEAARALGEYYALKGETPRAIDYYKTALVRFTKSRNLSGTKDVFARLVTLAPEDLGFFARAKRDIAKYLSPATGATLLQSLYKHYRDEKNWDVCIDLLKQILEVDTTDEGSRKALVECYRKKYEGVKKTEDYIRASNLTQSYRNVFEAISDFEKHIAFKTGTFVWHKTWGVGRITSITGDVLHINFGRKRGSTENETHDLQLKTAVNILTPLKPDHFWVIRATKSHDELKVMMGVQVEKDKAQALSRMEDMLKIIIRSFGNKCDMKRIRQEVVPSVLSTDEWTAWHSAAKKILETSRAFGVDPNDATMYTVLAEEANVTSKIADEFKAQKQFLDRVDTLMKYVRNADADKSGESEDYAEMLQYFMGFLKPKDGAHIQSSVSAAATLAGAVTAWLTVHEAYRTIVQMAHASGTDEEIVQKAEADDKAFTREVPFKEIYSRIPNPRSLYLALKDTKLLAVRSKFLEAIKDYVDDWDKQYITLFPVATDGGILDSLETAGKEDELTRLTKECIEGWMASRNAVIYLLRERATADWFKAAKISCDRQLIVLINIIDLTFREIENHVNTTENKKTNKAATALLFKSKEGEKDGMLVQYVISNGEEAARRMFTLINDIKSLNPSYKALLRSRILENYTDFVFPVTEEKVKHSANVMYVTAKKLEEKKAEAENIQNVEIPKNAAEIGEARKQGDLKENAEYKAAKEAQHFLNERLSQLTGEIAKAVVFDPATATDAVVSFGTEVTLHNSKTGKDEVKKIFGPWESDPDNGIISYLSPLGQALMEKKAGEVASSSREHDFSFFTVKAIKICSLN